MSEALAPAGDCAAVRALAAEAALIWLAGEGTGAIPGAVVPVDGGLAP